MHNFFTGNALKEIIEAKTKRIAPLIEHGISVDEQKEKIKEFENKKLYFNFKEKILNNISENKFSIIAEMKQKSPSAGLIIKNYNALEIAKIYDDNKATCLSVLTEQDYFGGDVYDMKFIKDNGIKLPILCKDFIFHKWQIYHARSHGADAILIILAAVGKQADELYEEALKLNLTVIVEVHTIEEAEYALKFKEALIGINNRNLKTLKTDINTTYDIYEILKDHNEPIISESGIKTKNELLKITEKTNIKTFLIGESLLLNLDKNSIFSVL